jgi:hypothetical protein
MLPWMIQSPLMPNIAILMASYTQALERTLEVHKYSETLSIKVHVLSLVNNFLRQDFDVVGGEALRAVIHLVILEVSLIDFRIYDGRVITHTFISGFGDQRSVYGLI